ncbi:MAG: GmrSD restriction endonuclease domain-containing protein, partial [Aeromonas sp.]
MLEKDAAIVFLGTLLTVDDSQCSTVYPLEKNSKPKQVKLVIDGQQRLTTLILIMLCLNEQLRILGSKIDNDLESNKDNENLKFVEHLQENIHELIVNTSHYVIHKESKSEIFKFLPKIIRANVDCWGKTGDIAKYASPLSEVLIKYQSHVQSHSVGNAQGSNFTAFDLSKCSSSRVTSNVIAIREMLDRVQTLDLKNEKSQLDSLCFSQILNSNNVYKLLGVDVKKDYQDFVAKNEDIKAALYLTTFANFILHRVCFTYVEVLNEGFAFDMFGALNTTGEPLTALETFVPKVINHINKLRKLDETYDEATSLSDDDRLSLAKLDEERLQSITQRFDKIELTKDKNDRSKALILSFARSLSGKVKVTTLRDQREAITDNYDAICFYQDRQDFLVHLKEHADFQFDYWYTDHRDLAPLVPVAERDVANYCFRYLIEIKHEIVQSILVQYIALDRKYADLGQATGSFCSVLKAVSAFAILWRGMTGGSDGIDKVYKDLHQKGVKSSNGEYLLPPYNLLATDLNNDNFDVKKLKLALKSLLENHILSKGSPLDTIAEQWLDVCRKQPIATHAKTLKMLLLAGYHQLELSGDGFVESTAKRNNFMTPQAWDFLSDKKRISMLFSKGNSNPDWSKDIAKPEFFNRIGNVFIDASSKYTVAKKEHNWFNIKQNMLIAMRDDSIEHLDNILSANMNAEAQRVATVKMFEKKYSEITYFEQWDVSSVNQRTELLLKNAWKNLIAWLE